jgi:hypothetical protein
MTNRFHMFLTAGLMLLAPALASAQAPRCSTLSGSYAVVFSGTFLPPGATSLIPYNGVGIQTFDGLGKITGTESGNFGGLILRNAPLTGTYTLNSDCTGTVTSKFPDGSLGHADFVVADGGKTIYAIGVDNAGPGAITTLTLTKMPVTW